MLYCVICLEFVFFIQSDTTQTFHTCAAFLYALYLTRHLQGYVDRDDMLIESLTVREMLYYSALLQLPGFFFQKKSFIEDAISAMSLGDFADSLIGGHCYTKSLPSGERRRVSIARELVMRPHVLFIDEPLYHLDRFHTVLSKDLQYVIKNFLWFCLFAECIFFQCISSSVNGYIKETRKHWLHSYFHNVSE